MGKRLYLESCPCSCENRKYLASFMDDSTITCDEETKTVAINFNEKNALCKTKNFYILLPCLLITTALLIAVSIYCYLTKHKAKQEQVLSFYVKNNEL